MPVSTFLLLLAGSFPTPADSLRISEIGFAPPDPALEYVEVVNTGSLPLALTGLALSDSRNVPSAVEAGGIVLAPDGLLVLVRDARAFADRWPGVLHLEVSPWPTLNNGSDEVVVSRDGVVLDQVVFESSWLDPRLPSGRSLERIDPHSPATGPTAWTSSGHASSGTPGSPNTAWSVARGRTPLSGEVRITEVLFETESGRLPPQPEFVEVAILADDSLDPNGLYVVIESPASESDSVRIGYAPDALRRSDVAVVAWPVPGGGLDRLPIDLLAAFPSSAGRVLPERVWPAAGARSLRNDGGMLSLYAPGGLLLDRIAFGPDLHHPALASTAGRSICRVDWEGPSQAPTNWTSSLHAEGATPGYRASPSAYSRPTADGFVIEPRVFTPDSDRGARHLAVNVSVFDDPSITDVRIFDLDGRSIRTLADGLPTLGDQTVYWNGLDDRELPAPAGPYVVRVTAWTPDGRRFAGRRVAILARR